MRRTRQLTLEYLPPGMKLDALKKRPRVIGRPQIDKKATLIVQLQALKFPAFETEFRFHGERKWRFDIAFVPQKIAVEIEGGQFIQGRHNRGASSEADMEKYGEAFVLGWRVLRVSPRLVKSGAAVRWLETALRESA